MVTQKQIYQVLDNEDCNLESEEKIAKEFSDEMHWIIEASDDCEKTKRKIINKGKGKGIADVEKVISSLPFLKTSTKGKKAAQAHVVDVEEMEIEQEADDNKKKKRYRIKEEQPATPQRVKGRYKKTKCTTRGGKKPTKKVTYPSCLTRSSPKAMYDAMVGLTEMRKKSLKDIGFERFINFPITELPGAFLYYVVDKFHPPSMELRDPDDPFIAEWESQYSNVNKITPAVISTEITSTFDVDFIFTINFLTLFAGTMGKVDNGAKVYTTVLKHVKENDVISDTECPVARKPAVQTDTAAKEETPNIEKRAAVDTVTATKAETPKTEKTAAVETPKIPKRTRNQVTEETKEEEEPVEKRTKKPSRYLVSPYNNKKTVINTPEEPDEMMVTNALLSMQGNTYEFVFQTEWAWGAATIRDNMQTLAPQLKVDSSVIDSFACVLCYEETITNSGSKIKQYLHTGILTTQIVNVKKEDEEKQYEEFCANLKSVFKGNPDDESMDHVELKKLFSRYLESHKHKKASDIATKKTTLMKLKWATKQNVIDCGVFVMMHMEHYGGEALKNWKFDFPKEGNNQELEIIRMRIKYATKMLMHELNIHRGMINEEAFEFAKKHTDKAMMQKMIREEIDKKKEEQAREHVASAK
ncbi:hypothetical protein CTI12_AA349270 [Artemisia annua]|uniref:Ulp1 protease family, C-terminal catalytic domain-containing protein n=1 Tax=Artemisia annua TaxID=35608 RepID=A0A2U1MQ72_ARTAN|nr:hypothetical protein CTI12_AA349270 [Artemisia annua]